MLPKQTDFKKTRRRHFASDGGLKRERETERSLQRMEEEVVKRSHHRYAFTQSRMGAAILESRDARFLGNSRSLRDR